MIIRHSINTENLVCDKSSRWVNEILLIKGDDIYKFSSENKNQTLVENGKLNLQILSKRDSELKEIPNENCKYYDKIIINNVVIYEKSISVVDRILKIFKKCNC